MQKTKKDIKRILGHCSDLEKNGVELLRKFWFGTNSTNIKINATSNANIFNITTPAGNISDDLFFLKTGTKKIKYLLVNFN
jgi:hypothetical protein